MTANVSRETTTGRPGLASSRAELARRAEAAPARFEQLEVSARVVEQHRIAADEHEVRVGAHHAQPRFVHPRRDGELHQLGPVSIVVGVVVGGGCVGGGAV